MKKILGILVGFFALVLFVKPAFAAGTLQSMITYYTGYTPKFARSATPFTSGVTTQTDNPDGSVTVSVTGTTEYADSGFVIYDGNLGDLSSFALTGSGQYGMNLWFDTNKDGEFFAWDSNNVLTGLAGDTYGLGPSSSAGNLIVNGSSTFFMMTAPYSTFTLDQLKAGAFSGIDSNTHIAIWVGVNTSSGSISATVNFPAPLTGKDVRKATGDVWMSDPNQQMQFSAFDQGISMYDKGTVEYWNYQYNGGTLHYTAPVLCAKVNGSDANFMFQIPNGWPGLSGIYVLSAVHDGGTPGIKGDTYGHTATWDLAQALSWCEYGTTVNNYPITAGNLVVH